jgi:hypothetical protein
MCENARNNEDADGCAAFLLCLVDCCLRCLEEILEYFNKFAYIYVGMVSEVTFLSADVFEEDLTSFFCYDVFSMDTATLKPERM